MEIIPLGVGGAFSKTLYQTNFLVRPGEGQPFLVDCGHTAGRALYNMGLSLRTIPTVIVSHLHGDHIGGLEELGFLSRFEWGVRPRLYFSVGAEPWLWTHALEAGMGQLVECEDVSSEDATMATYFDITVFDNEPFILGSVRVTPFAVPHVPGRKCCGFRLDDEATGGSAMLSCDTRFDRPNIDRYGGDADLIFHDCQLDETPLSIHTSLGELMGLPEDLQSKTLLIHYGDGWHDFKGGTGRLRFAEEGWSYHL